MPKDLSLSCVQAWGQYSGKVDNYWGQTVHSQLLTCARKCGLPTRPAVNRKQYVGKADRQARVSPLPIGRYPHAVLAKITDREP